MFTIEHDFDATRVTLIDEGGQDLREDVTIRSYEDRVEVEQFDARTGELHRVILSISQLQELRAAMNLPEGAYRLGTDKR